MGVLPSSGGVCLREGGGSLPSSRGGPPGYGQPRNKVNMQSARMTLECIFLIEILIVLDENF